MQFDYIHSHRVEALYAPLAERLHAERLTLAPQTPQTIVVGNLDTETFLQQKLVADDGVLMGVNFPFLESAIENFYARLRYDLFPTANESWFSPAPSMPQILRSPTLFDFEMVMLGILQDPQYKNIFSSLGYETNKLTPARNSALAYKLAREWYDYLLHIPETIFSLHENRAPELSAVADLSLAIAQRLKIAGYESPLTTPLNYPKKKIELPQHQAGLFLFGMPVLSTYHLKVIAGIARIVPVTLLATDFADQKENGDALMRLVGQKYAAYRQAMERAVKAENVTFQSEDIAIHPESTAQLSIYALPGVWRTGEIIGDLCHEALLEDTNLNQTDIGVALNDADNQFAAFERAFGMRTLTATDRATALTAPHAAVELWQILANAADSGVDRNLVMRYLQNSIVCAAYDLTPEMIDTWRLALERAQGFRNDYPEGQSAFSLNTAIERLTRSVFFCDMQSVLPPLRLSDSPTQIEVFARALSTLLVTAQNLGHLRGQNLFAAMHSLSVEANFEQDARYTAFSTFLDKVAAVPGSDFFHLSQIVSAADRHMKGDALQHTSSRDGVAFTKLFATCFFRKVQVLFDLNDSATARDEDMQWLIPHFREAETRLNADEQLAIALLTAVLAGNRRLIIAYSNLDPQSGAEFYPSQILSLFAKTISALMLTQTEPVPFAPTIVDLSVDAAFPIAAEDDLKTLYRLREPISAEAGSLTQLLLPRAAPLERASIITLRELFAFVCNPVLHILSQSITLPEDPPEFRFVEPRLAFSKSARTQFCEDYLEYALASDRPWMPPDDFVKSRQSQGDLPAGGFDQALRLLAQNENAARLSIFAEEFASRYRRIDLVFIEGISRPFIKQDSDRLDRYYIPAPELNGLVITGEVARLLIDIRTGEIVRLASGLQQKRILRITEMHLALCVLQLSGSSQIFSDNFSYAEYSIEGPKKDPDRLDAKLKNVCAVSLAGFDAAAYLTRLLVAYADREIFWFDLSSLSGTAFSNLVDLRPEKLIHEHELDSEFTRRPARSVFLKRFFNLSADERSVSFFNSFIRPLAAANATAKNGSRAPKRTRK